MSKKKRKIDKPVADVQGQIYSLFGSSYEAAINIPEVSRSINAANNAFTWKENPAAERKVNKILSSLAENTSEIIKSGVVETWDKGEKAGIEVVIKKYKPKELKEEAKELSAQAINMHRAKGATGAAYANEARGGMNISTRVWNLTDAAKKELEVMIQNGVLEGKSPIEISRKVRSYLKEPNALFRRVKNKETGDLELSKAAKAYHPGQGVYRSAYKNARRLAVTEMNAAYRRAEWESYQNNPLVTGYEIRLSNNHTTTNSKGKRIPLKDICDDMAGRYPKTFVWTGWHPQCRCEMIPILIPDSDFRARIKARKEGKLDSWKTKQVTAMPKGFNNWVENNISRIAAAKNAPYWVRDNYKNADITKGINKITPKQPVIEQPKPVEPITKFDNKIAILKSWLFALGGDLSRIEALRLAGDEAALEAEIKQQSDIQQANATIWAEAHKNLDLQSVVNVASSYSIDVKGYIEEWRSLAVNKNMNYKEALARLDQLKQRIQEDLEREKKKAQATSKTEEDREDMAAGKHLQKFIDNVNKTGTIKQLKGVLSTQLKDTLGYDVKVDIPTADITLEAAKRYAKRFVELCDDYVLEIPCTKLSFKKLKSVYGQVSCLNAVGKKAKYVFEVAGKEQNTGQAFDKLRASEVALNKSRCDEGKLQISTLTHEFAHNLYISGVNKSANAVAFKMELSAIRDSYYSEMKGLRPGAKEYNDIYLGRYANTNLDEFLAEAFQEYRNRTAPSKYARLVGELVDKHYKKK